MENFEQKPVGATSLDTQTRARLASEGLPPQSQALIAAVDDSFWKRNKWYVLILLVAVGVIGVLAYAAFRKPTVSAETRIVLEVTAPAEVQSGNEGVVKTVITNNDSKTIEKLELELVYPNGVVYVSSNPAAQNLSGSVFSLPNLSPGQNVAVLTKLRYEGGVGENRQVTAKLRYKLSGLSAEFGTQAQAATKLVAAGVTLDIQGPQNATNSELITYTIEYANQSQQSFDRVRVKVALPPGFQFAGSQPTPSQGKDTWDILGLPVGQSGQIAISGAYQSATPGQGAVVAAELLVPDASGGYFTQGQASFATQIAQTPLLVAQAWSGKTEGDFNTDPGEGLQYHITFKNNAPVAARGVRVIFTVESLTADLSTISAEGAVISGNTVTWSAASRPALEVLNPNESGSLDVSVRVKNPPIKDRSVNPDVVTSVKIISNEYDAYMPGNQLQVKLNTQPRLEGVSSFTSGPKPPKVGQVTRYTITLSLRNTTNDVTGGLFTAYIPNTNGFDMSSVTKAEAGKVTYDSSTGKLVWSVDTLPAHTGEFSPVRSLQFQVSATPASAQIGRPIVLMKDAVFKGVDSFTQKPVTLQVADMTSQEAAGGGAGQVVP
ncbi:MAG: hypothetical protein JNK33_00230 [Candidatus Doudnabacteria bacterium]|nr:hypothetical protein [Candidatus Doudnabacteria bacterium]